jgi:leucyl-tRNA synthetase
MDPKRSLHWQEEWARAGLGTGRRDPGRAKFYALIAYPGASGFFHVGHLRSFAYADALHRYHRALGEAVLFPFGLHASGIPAVSFAQRVKDRDPTVVQSLEDAGVPPPVWPALEDPAAAARFMGDEYRRVIRRLGVLFDDSTYVTTIDEDYQRFVAWQMRALDAAGEVVRGTYFASFCPVCGPVAVDPSETDLSSGGDAETVRFVTVPFALEDGRVLLAATLRPETVYGVTNVWLPPEGELVVWHFGEKEFLVARAGAERLVEQHGGRVGHSLPVAELVGRKVRVPLVGRWVPILANSIVDPAVGSGVMMSVPAHSPADAAALRGLPGAERALVGDPPVLIEIPPGVALTASEEALTDGAGTPAERALRATGAEGPGDSDALTEATDRLYRLEFVRGRMTIAPLAGVTVREARERVPTLLREAGDAFELQEFSKPVICRNGHTVIIRKVPDQWFLHYADPVWKAKTIEAARTLRTWPAEYVREMAGILDWFGDRPCARKGRWLGTPLPNDPSWIVEPIADSTLYMAYYLVRRFVSTGRLRMEQLTDAFFDAVFRGTGPGEPTVDPELTAEVRRDFLYWYPLDINMGGHEHKSVHFPVFLYTHAALLAPELFPRGIFLNGWITGPAGGKLSKKEVGSKGGRIPPIDRALDEWGADPLRLWYTMAADASADVEWNSEGVTAATSRLEDVERLLRESAGSGRGEPELDAWLASRVHRLVARVRSNLSAGDVRPVGEDVYVALPTLLRRYYARGGTPGELTDRVGRAWTVLLAPITPHLAEEVGEGRFPGLVALQPFPDPGEFPLSESAEAREEYLRQVEEDLRAVIRPAQERTDVSPDEVVFYVAAPWKRRVEEWMREGSARGETPNVRAIMERVAAHPEVTAYRAEIPKYVARVGPSLRSEPPEGPPAIDERETLRSAQGYLARRFGFRSVRVVAEEEGAEVDPLGRRDRARPGKPAFYLVRSSAPRAS